MDRIDRGEGEYVNRGVVPGRKVLLEEGTAAVMIVPSRTPHSSGPACTPQIELVRDGNIIQAIDVTCTCGQKIRLRCHYDESAGG